MERKRGTSRAGDGSREDRLKAALKSNLAKRKAQAKARATGPGDDGDSGDEQDKDSD
ncbi:hypothetical protein ROJ8625_02343 [Roseivivax jejudonensis]|uniref:Uncharacterized protein n=1 Tax=Roseivivax jejudonensis TaxID=1529041 RepID=A0A1X6ZDS7_9RHOB|nr:hypothetical protein [Roseivivax jejudonensis]SLN48240.1 hypothetical protein ROJ8625_02343 [Roseivivax jejudonensis]